MVFKVVVNNKDIAFYWFDFNNKTSSVYTWDANKNSDDFVLI